MENKARQERYLKELRPFIIPLEYSSGYFERRLDTLMSFVGNVYLYYIGKYKIPFTSIMHIIPQNADEGVRVAELGNVRMTFGRVSCFLYEKKIATLEIDSVREYIAIEIHNAMLFFAQKFNLPIEPLDKAYEELIYSRFLVSDNKAHTSPNRKVSVRIWLRYNWGTIDYWLQIHNKASKQSQTFFIDNIPCFYFIEHPELANLHVTQYMNSHIRDIRIVGWKSNTLIKLTSGEDHLLFNLESQTIIRDSS